jgi:hypothetical protein
METIDVHFENQRLYCINNNLPMFASQRCNHINSWSFNKGNEGVLQTLGESLIEKYGFEGAFKVSASTHIISCPGCGKSWCD